MQLTITNKEGVTLHTENKYCKEDIAVQVKTEELNITPNTEEQVNEGLFTKVTVAGDSNLLPENIKEGTSIFGVEGIAKSSSSNAKITNASYLFYQGIRIDYVNEILKLCENVTDMMYMFYNCTGLTELDLSNFNASNVTSMIYMFYNCSNLTNLDLSNIDASNVTTMSNMFNGCSKLTNLDLSNFKTKNITAMNNMFNNCAKLAELDLSSFNTSNVTNMQNTFTSCAELTELNLSSFNTGNVTNMSNMFNGCSKLTNLDLSSFDFSKVNNINSFVSYCYKLTNLKGFKDLGKGYTSKSNNYSSYWLDLARIDGLLTYESLMNIINNLYDLNLTYNVANGGTLYMQKLTLTSKDKAKLTAEEIAIATNKGWTVS